jgi:hypothetical protein
MMTWNDFFNFSDDKPLEQGIQGIERLEKSYVKMIDIVEASNARLASEFGTVKTNAEGLLTTVSKLNIGMEQSQKTLAGAAGESEDLVKQFQALKTVENDNAKLIATITAELEKLNKAKEKVKKTNTDEAGSMNDLRTRLTEAEKAYKAMGASADASVKEEQLAKVRGLAHEYKTVNVTLTDAKKAAVVAANSYNELSNRVAAAKKQLKEMEGGLQGNSKEFKELQKFAKEGTDQLKEFDESIGDNTRNVGGYQGAIVSAVTQLKAIPGAAGTADKALKLLSSNPVIFTLLAIGSAVAALTRYFKSSSEGQDEFNKVAAIGAEILDVLLDVVEAVGKALYVAITQPKKVWQEFMKLVEPLGAAITKAFEDPVQALKDFGKAVYENVVKRFEGIGKIFESVSKIISSGFTDGFKDLGNAVIQAGTGIEDGIDKIVKAFDPLMDMFDERGKRAKAIADLENKLMKDRIADITDDAKTELQANELLVASKDKLRFSDEERFNKLRQANKLLSDQLKGDLELIRDEIKLQELLMQRDGETYEAKQKLAELQAQEIGLQSSFIKARKKRQADEIALIREMEKDIVDSRKRLVDAEAAVNTVRLNDVIKTNDKILADEMSTIEDRLKAITSTDAARAQLLEQEKEQQLAAIKEAGLARMELSAEVTDQIYNQENLSIQARIELERKAKEELLATDEAYINQSLKVTEDFANKSEDLLEQSKKAVEDNIFAVLARDAAIFEAQFNTSTNETLKALNESFAAGDVSSLESFEEQKRAIQEKAQTESIESQIKYLKTRANLLETGSREQIQVLENISKLELSLSEMTAMKAVETEQKKQDLIKQIQNDAINAGLELMQSLNEAADAKREEELEKLTAQYEQDLELAGDNEAAKAQLRNDFEVKKKKLDAEQAAAERKRAIFQKALAITEIAINTAKGIAMAFGTFVFPVAIGFSIALAALGAVQIAAVASKPIPAFAEGTEDAPGGWALINEQGPEMIEWNGQRKIINSDGPTFAYVPRHAKVYTAEETEAMQEHEQYAKQIGVLKNGLNTVLEINQKEDNRELVDTMNRRMLSLEQTVRTKKEVHFNITKSGLSTWIKAAQSNTEFLDEYYD